MSPRDDFQQLSPAFDSNEWASKVRINQSESFIGATKKSERKSPKEKCPKEKVQRLNSHRLLSTGNTFYSNWRHVLHSWTIVFEALCPYLQLPSCVRVSRVKLVTLY